MTLSKIALLGFLVPLLGVVNLSAAGKKKFQEITFSEMDVQGSARTPDGAYLVQRRGLRFLPLYEVKKDLDAKIRKSTSYLK